ncbi:hypothetical protein, partial [Chroococcidiopsis sp.]|uniref:hypothetical protein n=1 Tax=Chroococcidiopsis sp. TaxID=3088168 RepID=UPI003F312FBC
MNIQYALTLSVDAIALAFAAMMAIDFAIAISVAWCQLAKPKTIGVCAETLAPIFAETWREREVGGRIPPPPSFSREALPPVKVSKREDIPS